MDFPIKEVAEELNNILQFWCRRTVDVKNGGFYGRIDGQGQLHPEADKAVILNTRILWTFSAAARTVNEEKYLPFAERAFHYLMDHFWDELHGGLFWMVDYQGRTTENKKQIYAQAFGIYGLSEFYLLTGNEEALERATMIFHLIEKHSYDEVNGGYLEALDRAWQPLEDMRLSDQDVNTEKSMNTHLHILEAYTNLFRAWNNEHLAMQLKDLIELFLLHIIDSNTSHLKLFFDKKWQQSHPDPISFGHDIETSWLLQEAAEVLENQEFTISVQKTTDKMAEITLAEGLDQDGSLYNERTVSGHIEKEKIWWCQAESLVGFLFAWKSTGKVHFLETAQRTWEFIKDHLIDKEQGEWIWGLDQNGLPDVEKNKVGPWKAPYHNVRACMEILKLFNSPDNNPEQTS